MEKTAANNTLKSKILKILPKAVSFGNLPFSPRRDSRADVNPQRFRIHQNKAFSGPMVSMIPAEARRKSKNFETQREPSSPKVSCTGQVKHKSKIPEKKSVSLPREFKPVTRKSERPGPSGPGKKKTKVGIKKIFRGGSKSDKRTDLAEPAGESTPALSQMRRFASSRETFANFDWKTAQIAPAGEDSDEDRGCCNGDDSDDDGGIPFSVPLVMAGGSDLDLEPKMEINLWKRRTMARPQSLRLNMGHDLRED